MVDVFRLEKVNSASRSRCLEEVMPTFKEVLS